MKKECLRCKKEYECDGYDWGICLACSQEILTETQEQMREAESR